MKLTNKYGIPQTFMNVLERPTYSKGKANISATQLLNSPKIVALTKKFDEELEQDVADMIWSLFGSAMHNILEHGKDGNHVVEQRIHVEHDGWHISGAIDLQIVNPDGTIDIRDYKTTSAWAMMNEKIEWEQQLNIYAWLIERAKKQTVNSVGIVGLIRDWNRREAATKEGYPEAPVKEIPIKLWSFEEREQFISRRVALHSACEFAMETEGDLPDCTPTEMWEKPTVWAVKKEGNIKAKALYETAELAEQAVQAFSEKDPKSVFLVEVRPGERTRCANFCSVSQYCQQYRDYLNLKEEV
jgi:phage terminase small subunit